MSSHLLSKLHPQFSNDSLYPSSNPPAPDLHFFHNSSTRLVRSELNCLSAEASPELRFCLAAVVTSRWVIDWHSELFCIQMWAAAACDIQPTAADVVYPLISPSQTSLSFNTDIFQQQLFVSSENTHADLTAIWIYSNIVFNEFQVGWVCSKGSLTYQPALGSLTCKPAVVFILW